MIKKKYSSYYLCFDIETSKVKLPDGTYFQIVYLVCSQLVNSSSHEVVSEKFFRNLNDFVNYLFSDEIIQLIDLKKKERVLCFAHNLDYELTFLLRETKSDLRVSDGGELNDWKRPRTLGVLRDKHAPLSIVLDKIPHIEFRCTYALSNKSLKQLGSEQTENFIIKHFSDLQLDKKSLTYQVLFQYAYEHFGKLDYEYNITRLPFHELTVDDYEYNRRDVDITRRYIKSLCVDRNYNLSNLPLSKTSMVVNDRITHTKKYYSMSKYDDINDELRKRTNNFLYHKHDYQFYMLQTKSYYGGTTTVNPLWTNRLIKRLYSIDIKSSYPHVMSCYRIPVYDTTSTILKVDEPNQYYHAYLHGLNHITLNQRGNKNKEKIKGYYGRFTFINVRLKDKEGIPTQSIRKTNLGIANLLEFNNKLISADKITYHFNNVGLDCFNLIYDYDDIICDMLTTTTKCSFLPLNEMTFILECFGKKETLSKDTLEYILSKENVNSQYGLKVQKLIKNLYEIVNGEILVIDYYNNTKQNNMTLEEWGCIQKEVYNFHIQEVRRNYGMMSENKMLMKRWDIFSDGTYITDLARYQLIDMVVKLSDLGFSVVYTDTDSIKFTVEEWQYNEPTLNDVKEINHFIQTYLDTYNESIIQYNETLEHFKTVKEWLSLDDKQFRKMCKLGIFEIESINSKTNKVEPYPYFKTLGAKKYAYINNENKIKTTIAGCNKNTLPKAIVNHHQRSGYHLHESLNECFSTGIVYPPEVSGRTSSNYEKRSDEELPTFYYEQEFINGEYHINKEIIYPLDQKGGVVIEPCAYTLDMKESDFHYLGLKYKKPQNILTIDGELREMTEEEKKKYLSSY